VQVTLRKSEIQIRLPQATVFLTGIAVLFKIDHSDWVRGDRQKGSHLELHHYRKIHGETSKLQAYSSSSI
jgi:hypothetical protein